MIAHAASLILSSSVRTIEMCSCQLYTCNISIFTVYKWLRVTSAAIVVHAVLWEPSHIPMNEAVNKLCRGFSTGGFILSLFKMLYLISPILFIFDEEWRGNHPNGTLALINVTSERFPVVSLEQAEKAKSPLGGRDITGVSITLLNLKIKSFKADFQEFSHLAKSGLLWG